MKVITTTTVNFGIHTLKPADQDKLSGWLRKLANWKSDESVRNASRLSRHQDVYVLKTPDDLDIAFRIDADKEEITVLDLARPSLYKTASE